ncbi:putative transcriptional regulator [Alkalihalobacillus xiaoxiensis]|uniref:Transcriptional regulator n=1 Tax=Shouchella xiaoxiensis TaxID=766895 RepID=A0ABS2SX29_9BACI|nr:hypothetical protein [Shouchella xiaoxiensis]MBM7839746.1 putative transcriptional regulator [Shouchella xiaoxiensis]
MNSSERMLFERDLAFLKAMRKKRANDESELAQFVDREIEELEQILLSK